MSERTLGELLSEALCPSAAEAEPIMAAGRGDSDALRQLADEAYQTACDNTGPVKFVALAEALTFSRLASVDGTRADLVNVVHILGELAAVCRTIGDPDSAIGFEAQGVFLAETMADQGDAEMADMIASNSDMIAPESFQEAKRLREGQGSTCTVH